MLEELPDLGDIFNKNENDELDNPDYSDEEVIITKDIYIYISKDNIQWTPASFTGMAPGNIGLHLLLPLTIEYKPHELDNFRIRFTKKKKNKDIILKEAPVLVRWQERDTLSGKMKVGVHFHGQIKSDPQIVEILNEIKTIKKLKSE